MIDEVGNHENVRIPVIVKPDTCTTSSELVSQ